MKFISVACAIIIINEKTLVVQRSENMSLPLKWEFPGGKIEVGEDAESCIIREIKEELGITIKPKVLLKAHRYLYPTFEIELVPFICEHVSGEIKLTEHKQFLLLDESVLNNLDWAEADIAIVEEYKSYLKL